MKREDATWGMDDATFNRLESIVRAAIDKYEPGKEHERKAPGEYPCCDAMHELHTAVWFIGEDEPDAEPKRD